MIRAEVHTDDMALTARFDATPYFEGATDDEIVALGDCGWGGDYEADAVAKDVEDRPGYGDVAAVLERTRDAVGMGFECNVHAADAFAWVSENRPALHSGLLLLMGRSEDPDPSQAPDWDDDPSWPGDYAVPAPSPAP